jgi:hypothetical protein
MEEIGGSEAFVYSVNLIDDLVASAKIVLDNQ